MRRTSAQRLAAVLAALKEPEKVATFLAELLTPCEMRDIALRWELVELLAEGVSQRAIAARLGVSLCKITRGAKILKGRKSVVADCVATDTGGRTAVAKKGGRSPASVKAAAKAGSSAKGKKVVNHGTRVARKSEGQARR